MKEKEGRLGTENTRGLDRDGGRRNKKVMIPETVEKNFVNLVVFYLFCCHLFLLIEFMNYILVQSHIYISIDQQMGSINISIV